MLDVIAKETRSQVDKLLHSIEGMEARLESIIRAKNDPTTAQIVLDKNPPRHNSYHTSMARLEYLYSRNLDLNLGASGKGGGYVGKSFIPTPRDNSPDLSP